MFSPDPEQRRGGLSLWLVLFLVWSATSVPVTLEVVVSGLAVTFFITAVLMRKLPGSVQIWNGLSFTPRRALAFLRYSAVFLREMVKSNLKVMRYVYAHKIEIHPGIVATHTRLRAPFARFTLANTIALTPGSLVMGMQGQTVYLHGLDLKTTDIDANTQTYLGAFDPLLEKTFG